MCSSSSATAAYQQPSIQQQIQKGCEPVTTAGKQYDVKKFTKQLGQAAATGRT